MTEIVPPSSQLNRRSARSGNVSRVRHSAPKTGHRLTRLAYMLAVINDPEADYARRDKLAVAALPFCHPRIADREISKRDRRAKLVQEIINGDNSSWGSELRPKPDQFEN